MNISEDSSDGITLDDVEPRLSTTYSSGSDFVLYMVTMVNQNETSAVGAGSITEEIGATSTAMDTISIEQQTSLNLDCIANSSDGIEANETKEIGEVPEYSLGTDLIEIDTAHHLLTEFGNEELVDRVMDSTTEEITVGNDVALTLPIQDSITSQLLQPSLSTEENDSDDIVQPNYNSVSNIATVQVGTSSAAPTAITVPQNEQLNFHRLVDIGGQPFLIVTGPTQAKLDKGSEAPPGKKIRLGQFVTDSPSTQTLEGLQGISDIELSVPEAQSIQQVMLKSVKVDKNITSHGLKQGKSAEDLDVTQTWFTTKDDKLAFQNTGQTWKQGQWSKDEIDVLQANIADYCKENNILEPTQVIFMKTKEDRKNFYRTISKGLNRPLFSVYRRVVRMYDSTNHIGKYSPEEVEQLRMLRKKFGTDWAAIGTAMGRSPSSVKDRCRLLKDQCNSGKWLPEEERRLTEAIQSLTGMVPGESVTSGLSWAAVAEQVGTRSEKQCRTKWVNYLNWKQRGGTDWNRADDLALIDKIYNLRITEENEIHWENLAAGWPSARSPQWLRGKWGSLKRHVQDYQLLSFSEIINYLKATNRTIIRSSGKSDSYAVKMSSPLPLFTVNVSTNASANTMGGDSIVQQYQSMGNVSHVLTADGNCDQNILHTLTQQQMVEMQPGGGTEFLNASGYSTTNNAQTLVFGHSSHTNFHNHNLEQNMEPGSVGVQHASTLEDEDVMVKQESLSNAAISDSLDSTLETPEECLSVVVEPQNDDGSFVIVQTAAPSQSTHFLNTDSS